MDSMCGARSFLPAGEGEDEGEALHSTTQPGEVGALLSGDGVGDGGVYAVQIKAFCGQLGESFQLGRLIEV